jgi:hypothetical protein
VSHDHCLYHTVLKSGMTDELNRFGKKGPLPNWSSVLVIAWRGCGKPLNICQDRQYPGQN